MIPDYNHGLSHGAAETNRRSDGRWIGPFGWYYLQQRHSLHRREERQPPPTARAAGPASDIPDGNGGGIACEDRFRRNLGLYFRQHPTLDREVFEHRLDDQIEPGEPAVIGGAGEEAGEPLLLRTAW